MSTKTFSLFRLPFLGSSLTLSLLCVSSLASAQPGGYPAAAPGSVNTAASAFTCSLGEHSGIDDADAGTAKELLCSELWQQGVRTGRYEVRMGKLGGRILFSVVGGQNDASERRTVLLSGIEEVPKAVPRISESLKRHRPLDETRTTTNVLEQEAGSDVKTRQGYSSFYAGLFGMGNPAVSLTPAAGVDLGVVYTARYLGIEGHGRAGGIGSQKDKVGTVSLDLGGRYYVLGAAEHTPFLGAGLGFGYFRQNREPSQIERSGSGLLGYVQVGAELLRAYKTNVAVSLRADLPMFTLASDGADSSRYTLPAAVGAATPSEGRSSKYAVPLSLNLGLQFR